MKRKKLSYYFLSAFIIFSAIITAVFMVLLSADNEENVKNHEGQHSSIVSYSLCFNEVMSSNKKAFHDDDGNYFDWIELYNYSSAPIDLAGFGIGPSDTEEYWFFPDNTIIDADSYLILWFCGYESDGLYLPYKISKYGGDSFILYDNYSNKIDEIYVKELDTDCVYFRNKNNIWMLSTECTPGFENTENGRQNFLKYVDGSFYQIRINEFCPRNDFGLKAADGGFYDWIELYNFGNTYVNLESFFLTDDPENECKWRFPSYNIMPGEYLVIFASGLNSVIEDEIHASFKLSSDGGTVALYSKYGSVVSEVSYSAFETKYSSVSFFDGIYDVLSFSTPGFENSLDGYYSFLNKLDEKRGPVIINEVLLHNDFSAPCDGKKYYDWVELYNRSDSAVNLSGYCLSDTENNIKKYQLPDLEIKAGEYILIYLSGDTSLSTLLSPHTSFKIADSGEILILSDETYTDYIYLSDLPYGYSYGRKNNEDGYFYFDSPTPRKKNSGNGLKFISDFPVTDIQQGVYNDVDSVEVALLSEGEIRYTLDGSVPTFESELYTGPLVLSQTTVIRAIAFEEGKYQSGVASFSYIINENHTLPVVSLVTDPVNLWDETTGIYVLGPNAEAEYPYNGANYYNKWERAANVSLYENGNTVFSEDCGIEIFGQSSRVKDKKSFEIKFREKYGVSYLRCNLFESRNSINRFDRLILRSGAQDYDRSVFRDELLTELIDGRLDVLVQANKPCILYLNGEYWGIYFIREKADENFVSQHINVNKESVTVLRGNSQREYGSNSEYKSFFSKAKTLDMSLPNNYKYVTDNIDIISYIDYYIAEAYTGNRDLINVRFYKSSESDNKWHWIVFDLDYGFDYPYTKHTYGLATLLQEGGIGKDQTIDNTLLIHLFDNEDFFDLFMTRYGLFLNTVFSEENVLALINSFYDMIAPEIQRNASRWNFSVSRYKWYVGELKDFVRDGDITRKNVLINEAISLFSLSEDQVLQYFYGDITA